MTIRLVLTVAVLVALAGCGDPRFCGQVDTTTAGEEVTQSASGFPLVTGDVTLELKPPRFALCPAGFKYPSVTDVRVFDTAGKSMLVTWQVVQGRRVQAAFHADLAGLYELEVDYTPDPRTDRAVVTISSRAFLVVERPLPARLQLGYYCFGLERTARGTWICDERVLRGTTLVQSLRKGVKYVVAGNSVWNISSDGRSVERWIDTGAGPLTAAGAGTYDPGVDSGAFSHFVATADEAALRFDKKLIHLGWTAGPSPSPRVLGSFAIESPAYGEMRWEPPLIAIGFNGYPEGRLCPFTLQAGSLTPAGDCLPLAKAQTEDGYWTFTAGELSLFGFKDGVLRWLDTFPVPASYGPVRTPVLGTRSNDPERPGRVLLIVRPQPGGAAYDAYAIGAEELEWRQRDYFWWHPASGGTEVMVP